MENVDITGLLIDMRLGNAEAFDKLFPVVYEKLHRMAHHQLAKQRGGQTLNTTGLLHEAYIKLVEQSLVNINDRNHFYAVSATAMRQIIVDHARKRLAKKRGSGKVEHTELEAISIHTQADALVEIDSALTKLSTVDDRLARVVELRFFAGFSVEESATLLGCSPPTVKRDTRMARAFIHRELAASHGAG